MSDRLAYIKEYFAKENKVKLEIKPTISETTKGRVIYRFNGQRAGIDFKDGIGYCERKDLYKIRESFPYIIIHEEGEKE